MSRTAAANEMMRVLQEWGVKRIYGLPGGSLDSTMDAIHNYLDRIDYIGVRHEEVASLAAVAEAKLTGRIGVMLGSAGPGAVHLLNGLYDAKYDNIPVLAIVGQVPTKVMNTDYFQEIDEQPIFSDVAVYDRVVMTAEQLPLVIDTAIRTAYAKKGPAVVIIPKDLGWAEIEDSYVVSAHAQDPVRPEFPIDNQDVTTTLDLMNQAKRPIIYFGQGAKHASKQLKELSDLTGAPLVSSYLAKGILPHDDPSYMLSAGRVSTKSGTDIAAAADFVLFVATNYEFGVIMYAKDATFVDVNIDPMVLGARHGAALGVQADAEVFLQALVDGAHQRDDINAHSDWLAAAQEDRAQWEAWLASRPSDQVPLRLENVFHEINRVAADNAIFGIDVGNVNIASARLLHVNPGMRFTTSPLYATMGYGLPAAMAAAEEYPDHQVWALAGDGAEAMVIPDLVTVARRNLPIISVVLTNESLGYIEAEQDDTHQPHSGVDLDDVDFAQVARGFGVRAFQVRTQEELHEAIDQAVALKQPVLIDAKVTDERQLPVEHFPKMEDTDKLQQFQRDYATEGLEPIATILKRHGVEWEK